MVGPPRKQLLPLLLLVSLVAFIFFSHYHSFHHISPANSLFPIDANTNFIPQNTHTFTFLIKVLAFNRLDSLSRCLNSLANANYDGDIVHLHIYIDHFPFANDSSTVLDQKLDNSHRMLEFVDGFKWEYGNKVVHYRTGNVGLQAQWLEAWWPSSNDEFAFIVEDDLEVSPLFYRFVKATIVNYYYNATRFSPSIYGISLQRPRFVPGKHGNKIQLDNGTPLFLYQLVGTWGQILFPKPWKEFRLWYDNHKAKGIKPFLDGMVTNGWYKRMGERIWTPWFIKFVHYSGYFSIYTNLGHERALSVSHRDAGVNYGKTAGPDSQLVVDESSLDYKFVETQPLTDLKWYDFCFREVLPGRVVRSVDGLGSVLPSVQKHQTVMLLSIFWTSDAVTRNLLCHFERLNIQNYMLMGPGSDFLYDLARRGHPVIDTSKLFDSMRARKLFPYQDSRSEVVDILVKAYVMEKCLEYRYNSWILDANMVFVNNDFLQEFTDTSNDFYAGRNSEILLVRSSSSSTQKIWGDGLLNKLAIEVGQVSLPRESRKFVSLLAKTGVRIKWADENIFGIKIGANRINQSSLKTAKMVYWSMEMDLNLVQERLQELGMWTIDSDSSCKAVICHQS